MKSTLVLLLILSFALATRAQDQTSQTLSDYFFYQGSDITLPLNAKIKLAVGQFKDDFPFEASSITAEQWTIDGKDLMHQSKEQGELTFVNLQIDKGIYTAPAKVPPHNPVVITVSFHPEGQATKIILICRIHIINKENYFYLSDRNSIGGTLYELKEPLIPSRKAAQETAFFVNDQWNIGANGFQKSEQENSDLKLMGIGIGVVGDGKGTYTWTVNGSDNTGLKPPCNTVAVSGTDADGAPFQYMSVDCIPHGDSKCKPKALAGNTTISVFDKKNKIIKGYFSGILMSAKKNYVWVSGAFSVNMN